jgi:hypothetical protein
MNRFAWLKTAIRDVHNPMVREYNDETHWKIVNHHTETKNKPSYSGWTINPHVSVMPIPGVGVQIYQHLSFLNASFALRDLPGGVRPNRDAAIQIEFIGTCSKTGPGYYWPGADLKVLAAVYTKLYRPLMNGFGIPWIWAPMESYEVLAKGVKSVRMSSYEFDLFTGFLGHLNVPENNHLDGEFKLARLNAIHSAYERNLAKPVLTPVAKPVPLMENDMRLVLISTDKKPQRIFFLRDVAQYVPLPADVNYLRNITGQTGTLDAIPEDVFRRYWPEASPIMNELSHIYDELKEQGASIDEIQAAQAKVASDLR